MMLFICEYCGKDYKMIMGTNTIVVPAGQYQDPGYQSQAYNQVIINLSYQYDPGTVDSRGNPHPLRTVMLKNSADPCHECVEASEKAKTDKLQEIKRAAGRVDPE